jgi:chaperonin GroES
MNFRPLGDRVLVERADEITVSKGGILLGVNTEKPSEGKVLAVGNGKRAENTGELMPLELKVGDRIMFGKWSGNEIKIGEKQLLIMNESDVLGVIDDA